MAFAARELRGSSILGSLAPNSRSTLTSTTVSSVLELGPGTILVPVKKIIVPGNTIITTGGLAGSGSTFPMDNKFQMLISPVLGSDAMFGPGAQPKIFQLIAGCQVTGDGQFRVSNIEFLEEVYYFPVLAENTTLGSVLPSASSAPEVLAGSTSLGKVVPSASSVPEGHAEKIVPTGSSAGIKMTRIAWILWKTFLGVCAVYPVAVAAGAIYSTGLSPTELLYFAEMHRQDDAQVYKDQIASYRIRLEAGEAGKAKLKANVAHEKYRQAMEVLSKSRIAAAKEEDDATKATEITNRKIDQSNRAREMALKTSEDARRAGDDADRARTVSEKAMRKSLADKLVYEAQTADYNAQTAFYEEDTARVLSECQQAKKIAMEAKIKNKKVRQEQASKAQEEPEVTESKQVKGWLSSIWSSIWG